MKRLAMIVLAGVSLGLSQVVPVDEEVVGEEAAATEATPREVVERRMRALNAHDLEGFLDCYADDVALAVYPDRPLGSGREHLRWIFEPALARGDVSVEVLDVLESGPFVVVESRTTFGDVYEEGLAVFDVRDGRIQSVRFLRDSQRAERTPVTR